MSKELEEIRDILSEFKEEILTSLEHQFSLLDYKFNMLNNSFEKLEENNSGIEEDIKQLQFDDINHINNCPKTKQINEIDKRIIKLEKEDTKQLTIKTFLNRTLIVSASVFAFLLTAKELYETFLK